jgi:glycine reductase
MAYKVVHFINQFFAGIGGEEMGGHKPEARKGFVGPGQALNAVLGPEAEIVGTVICGDTYFADNLEKAEKEVLDLIASFAPDAVSRSCFHSRALRYCLWGGMRGGRKEPGDPDRFGMYPEEPRGRHVPQVDLYRQNGDSAGA